MGYTPNFIYPTGPDSCEGAPSDCPLIDEPQTNPGIIFQLVFWAVCIAIFALHYYYRYLKAKVSEDHAYEVSRDASMQARDTLKSQKSSKLKPTDYVVGGTALEPSTSGSDVELMEDGPESETAPEEAINLESNEKSILQKPFKEDFFGTICSWLVLVISFNLFVDFFTLLMDQYIGCQLKSIDSTCFYGYYPITGGYDVNSELFFIWWWISLFWFTGFLFFRNDMVVWFLVPTNMEEATQVYIWTKVEVEELSVEEVHWLVQSIREWKIYITPEPLRTGKASMAKVKIDDNGARYIEHEATRYTYLKKTDCFILPTTDDISLVHSDLHKASVQGLDTSVCEERARRFGPNEIPFHRNSLFQLFQTELFGFFYLYQFIMYALWMWFSYLFVAIVELSVVILGAVIAIYIQYESELIISALTVYVTDVTVRRDGKEVVIPSTALVPGDVVVITESNWVLPADMVLVKGSIIMDESGLTGESMPVQKIACPADDEEHSNVGPGEHYSLFSGTTVLTRIDQVEAIVTSVGVSTSKGQLISTILYPKEVVFRYEEELNAVIAILLVLGIFSFILVVEFISRNGSDSSWVTKWIYGTFTISQVFSPLLPVALKVGQIRSQKRLQDNDIFCISPRRIAICGKVNVFCFDKTGTLTLEGLEFHGVAPCLPDGDGTKLLEMKHDNFGSDNEMLEEGMATCHAVAKYIDEKTAKTEYVGNSVEVNMFKATGWSLGKDNNVSNAGKSVTILRKYDFDHGRQLMSVVTNNQTGDTQIVTKGSFEKVAELCGSVPEQYHTIAKNYAIDGGYVLAMAAKKYELGDTPLTSVHRDSLETKHTYTLLGLLVFRNEPKPDSLAAIQNLREGDVRPVMITGDNAQCGQYIARKVGMVDKESKILLAEMHKATHEVEWRFIGEEDSPVFRTEDVMAMKDMKTGGIFDRSSKTRNLKGTPTVTNDRLELAVTGNPCLDILMENKPVFQSLIMEIRIFARMSPEHKTELVTYIANRGNVVGMCGDGGNDCGALRAAHAGIALSDAEASVVSPFTSKQKSPMSTVDLLREGRASLATSFGNYKFLILYGQVFLVVKLVSFWYGILMNIFGYYIIDAIIITSLSYTMTLSEPVGKLEKIRPTASLLGPITVISAMGAFIIWLISALAALSMMNNDPDYVVWPASLSAGNQFWYISDNWEATIMFYNFALFLVQYAALFSLGYRFRLPIYKNLYVTINVIVMFVLLSVAFLSDPNDYNQLFHTASAAYNIGPTSDNPIWQAYAATGEPPTPGMSFSLRIRMYLMWVGLMVANWLFQAQLIEGFIGDWVRKTFPRKKRYPYLV